MNRPRIVLLSAVIATLVITAVFAGRFLQHAQAQSTNFVPPGRTERRAAIGVTNSLSPSLRKAFADSDLFSPVPKPEPADWLASHPEAGQTFTQFARGNPNRPDQTRNTLYFVPLGDYENSSGPALKSLKEFASAYFAMPVKTLPMRALDGLPIKVRSRSGGPNQLLSTDVLNWLEPLVPDDAFCLLAITMEDLYPDEKWNFVFGQASLSNRVGVYSFIRYTPQFNGQQANESAEGLVLRRSCKVLGHETGHMFGIKHCVHFHCLMNGSNHLQEADRQPMHLCPVCLRKLQSSVNFDVTKRYESLKQYSQDASWDDEAAWLGKRIESIR